MIKKSTLANLPEPETLRRKAQSISVLEAIMSPEWQYRYYSFNSRWSEDEMMASMTDSCGDNFFMLFNTHGAIAKGFDHDSFMSPWARSDKSLCPGMFKDMPSEFAQFLTEPAFDIPNTTFCIWRKHGDDAWRTGVTEFPDNEDGGVGSEELLSIFVGGPETYAEFARRYYEKELPIDSVDRVYRHEKLTDDLLRRLNPTSSVSDLERELPEIGYPG